MGTASRIHGVFRAGRARGTALAGARQGPPLDGWGIVEHGRDLTYSLLVPRSLPLATLPAAESYRLIHAAVAAALAATGLLMAELLPASAVQPTTSRACFEKPVPYDLMLSGRKLAGGAQRRTRRGLLHQGSIQPGQEEAWPSCERQFFPALAGELPKAFARNVDTRAVSAAEVAAAHALTSAKYGSPAWLGRF